MDADKITSQALWNLLAMFLNSNLAASASYKLKLVGCPSCG